MASVTSPCVGVHASRPCPCCGPVSAALPPSKSHPKRSYHWLPAAPGSFHRGTLTVLQSREADSYQLDEDTSTPFPCRSFLLLNIASGDVYEVTVAPGNAALCSGQWCGRHPSCKHRSAVLDLLAAGALDGGPGTPAAAPAAA